MYDEHIGLRQRYPEARLLWSGDWSSFASGDSYVTVMMLPFDTPDQANAWCDRQGIDADHCFTKRVATTSGPEQSTRHR